MSQATLLMTEHEAFFDEMRRQVVLRRDARIAELEAQLAALEITLQQTQQAATNGYAANASIVGGYRVQHDAMRAIMAKHGLSNELTPLAGMEKFAAQIAALPSRARSAGPWIEMCAGVLQILDLAATFQQEAKFNTVGSEALAGLIRDMALTLDGMPSLERILEYQRAAKAFRDKEEYCLKEEMAFAALPPLIPDDGA